MFLEQVAGLMDAGPVRTVAGAPAGVLGLAEWKGRLLTVLDLPALIGEGPRPEPASLVRLGPPYPFTALYVPATVRMEALQAEEMRPFSEPGVPAEGCLLIGGERLVLLETAALVERLESVILRRGGRMEPGSEEALSSAGGA
jgi:chemotaxis signal transduction protein